MHLGQDKTGHKNELLLTQRGWEGPQQAVSSQLWLSEVTPWASAEVVPWKSEPGLVQSAQFSREPRSLDLCSVYKCWQGIRNVFKKHSVGQAKCICGQSVTSELDRVAISVVQTLHLMRLGQVWGQRGLVEASWLGFTTLACCWLAVCLWAHPSGA